MMVTLCHRALRPLVAVSVTALLVGCAVVPVPFTQKEFSAKAKADRALMFNGQEPLSKPLTLPDAVARVLLYNLDKRSKMMEEALALGQLDLDHFDLLPKLTAGAGYAHRSDHATTTSTDSVTLKPSLANPSYSLDRTRSLANLGLTWNLLDFGVSYFNAHQNADRVLIAAERRRKTVANLVQEVRFSFWKAAAAQVLKDKVVQTVAAAEAALANSETVEAEKLRNPMDTLRLQKALLESIRQLEGIDQELITGKAELAALTNMPPGSDFTLDLPGSGGMAIPQWPLTIDTMEEMALANNPDLREQDYQSRISVADTRKEMLKLLPGVSLNFSRQYDSNSFLQENRWNEAGAQITWNLLNLLSAPARINQAKSTQQLVNAKRLALRMAVLAQVHVISSQYHSAAKQFERADKLWSIEQRLAEASGNQQRSGTANEIERISVETSAISSELRRFQTYAQLQSIFGKLQTTIGADPISGQVDELTLDGISKVVHLGTPLVGAAQ